MKRSFVSKTVHAPNRVLHKVVRDDQMQMQTCDTKEEADRIAEMLNSGSRLNVGNAHRLRNDCSIPKNVTGVMVRAWAFDDHVGFRVYREVLSHLYESHWAQMRRPIIFKNFRMKFHPQQRGLLAFTVEYIRGERELDAVNRSARYKSGRMDWSGQ